MSKVFKSRFKPSRRLGVVIWENSDRAHNKGIPGKAKGAKSFPATSIYAVGLRNKQAVKFHYLISEKFLKNSCRKFKANRRVSFDKAFIARFETMPTKLLSVASFCTSAFAAKQLVSHKHVLLNGRSFNLPRIMLKSGDVLSIRPDSVNHQEVVRGLEKADRQRYLPYLEVDYEKLSITLLRTPTPEEMYLPFPFDFTKLASFY